jgi:hypothetical protein
MRNPPSVRILSLFAISAFGLAALACADQTDSTTETTAQTGGTTSTVIAGTGGSTTTSASGGSSSTAPSAAKFSFFVTSYKAIQALSGSAQGFGGDLRHGETGTGAGLRGADKICTETAELSMAGNAKVWRAFLSTSAENAIDRIGEGPWYDRLGRVVALTKANLLATRPVGADAAIVNDLPNEDGVPNHAPDGKQVDNHDTLTGTGTNGQLYNANAACSDWTSSAKDTSNKPRVGHTWPRAGGGGPMGGGGMEHWISALDESGCGAGVNLIETGAPGNDGVVGSGGGYGGIYCFALTP